jgi:hypothetical protein
MKISINDFEYEFTKEEQSDYFTIYKEDLYPRIIGYEINDIKVIEDFRDYLEKILNREKVESTFERDDNQFLFRFGIRNSHFYFNYDLYSKMEVKLGVRDFSKLITFLEEYIEEYKNTHKLKG